MWPDCSPPRMLPAPRISRSESAIWNPAPELRGVEDRLEPLSGVFAHPLAAAVEQVGVRAPRRPAHPAAELVELRQAQRVGSVDDDRVGVRDVEPGLDDRGADQDVRGAIRELEHHRSRGGPRPSGRARPRSARLAGASEAAPPGPRSSRPGCGRRRPGRRDRARAGSRRGPAPRTPRRPASGSEAGPPAASRSRDMSRTPASARLSVRGIGVADSVRTSTSRLSCLSRSLAATPKRCSSSTTTRPRSLNRTSFDSSRCVPITRSTEPSARPCTALSCSPLETNRLRQRDLDRERPEPRPERGVVLGREDRGRHEHGDLLAILRRLEGRPDRDLGLAVAHVADDQPVHRLDGFHVVLDLDDGARTGRRSPRTGRRPPSRPARACRRDRRGRVRRRERRTARGAPRRGRRPPCGRGPSSGATRCRRASTGAGSRRRSSARSARSARRARRSGPGPGRRAPGSRARRPCRRSAGASARSGRCRGRCGRRGRRA